MMFRKLFKGLRRLLLLHSSAFDDTEPLNPSVPFLVGMSTDEINSATEFIADAIIHSGIYPSKDQLSLLEKSLGGLAAICAKTVEYYSSFDTKK